MAMEKIINITKRPMGVEELIEEVKRSPTLVVIGRSGKPEVVITKIKDSLGSDQKQALPHLKKLLEKMSAFEEQYGMDSAEFYYKFENLQVEENGQDFLSWWIQTSAFFEALQRFNLTRSDVECQLTDESNSTSGK